MPLFMFLAGCSTFFALKNRSSIQFVQDRVTRILTPLLLGILIIVPPQVYVERVFRGQFEGSYWDFYPHFFSGIYPKGNFSWHHLWFLAYLFVYSIVSLPIFRLIQGKSNQSVRDNFVGLLMKPLGLYLFALPLIFFHIALFWQFPPTNALLNDWGWHSQLFLFFVFGYVLVSDQRIELLVASLWMKNVKIAIALTATFFGLRLLTLPSDTTQGYWFLYGTKGLIYRTCGWAWILALFGIGKNFLNVKVFGFDQASEAAYPFYILHQTIIVLVAGIVVSLPVPTYGRFSILFITSFVFTVVIYQLARRIRICRFALGMKPPRHISSNR